MDKKTNFQINFLRKQRSILALQSKRSQMINSFSLIAVISYVVILISVFSYSGYLKFRLNRLEKDISAENKLLERMNDTKLKYYTIKSKTDLILGISKNLYSHQDVFKKTVEIVPEGMYFNNLSINSKEDGTAEVRFSIKTFEVSVISDFLDKINKAKLDNKLPIIGANIGGINIGSEGEYLFGVTLFMKETANT